MHEIVENGAPHAAAVKFVVRDLAKPPESAASVLLITETRTRA